MVRYNIKSLLKIAKKYYCIIFRKYQKSRRMFGKLLLAKVLRYYWLVKKQEELFRRILQGNAIVGQKYCVQVPFGITFKDCRHYWLAKKNRRKYFEEYCKLMQSLAKRIAYQFLSLVPQRNLVKVNEI